MSTPKKILIIDDEETYVKMITNRLKQNGYTVVAANNGDEGLKKAESEKPDLMLLDIMMPGMDGYTMLLEFKKSDTIKNIPIIIVSCKEDMKDLFAAAGIHDFLVKPFDFEDLLIRIKKHIGA